MCCTNLLYLLGKLGDNSLVIFMVIGNNYDMNYYFADDIYSDWPTFVNMVWHLTDLHTQHFAAHQESGMKGHRMIIWCATIKVGNSHGSDIWLVMFIDY